MEPLAFTGSYPALKQELVDILAKREEQLMTTATLSNCPNCGVSAAEFTSSRSFGYHTRRCGGVERAEGEAKLTVAPRSLTVEDRTVGVTRFSEFGFNVYNQIKNAAPLPVLIRGETGWGKSHLARVVCDSLERKYIGTNAHPGMDIGLWVGQWRPEPVNSGITLIWQDGLLTGAIKSGNTFFLEEITRAPQEAMARIFGLLDHNSGPLKRYWSVPEAGIDDMPVHEDFWLIATCNPPDVGYYASRLDKALESRFAVTVTINEPIADERALLGDVFNGDTRGLPDRIYNFVLTCRRSLSIRCNTRDMLLASDLIKRGYSAVEAIDLSIAPKYPGNERGLHQLAAEHFVGV